MSSKGKGWRHTAGEYGCRVAVFERWPGSNLYVRKRVNGKYRIEVIEPTMTVRDSEGKLDADQTAVARRLALELSERIRLQEDRITADDLTVAQLVEFYSERRLPFTRSGRPRVPGMRRRVERQLTMWQSYLGASTRVATLNVNDFNAWKHERRTGKISAAGKPASKPVEVSDRVLEKDLSTLRAVFRWAMTERDPSDHTRRLLAHNPLDGVDIPKGSGSGATIPHAWHSALVTTARLRDEDLFADLCVVCEGTGHRIGAVRQLRWEHIRFDAPGYRNGSITWVEGTDKNRREHVTAMATEVADALKARRRRIFGPTLSPAIGYVFEHPVKGQYSGQSVRPYWLNRKWIETRKAAGLEPLPKGTKWHGYRRKFATERAGHSSADVARQGGWSSVAMVHHYQKVDPARASEVVDKPTSRYGESAA